MSICSMCGRPYDRVNDDTLENGAPICPECASRFETVLNSYDPDRVKDAVNYIYSCARQTRDDGVRACLDSFIENNSAAADEAEREASRRRPIAPVDVKKNDYYTDRDHAFGLSVAEPGVCKVLFICGLVIIVLGLIAAIVFGSGASGFGFWVFISIALGAAFAGLVLIGLAYVVGYLASIAQRGGGDDEGD